MYIHECVCKSERERERELVHAYTCVGGVKERERVRERKS